MPAQDNCRRAPVWTEPAWTGAIALAMAWRKTKSCGNWTSWRRN